MDASSPVSNIDVIKEPALPLTSKIVNWFTNLFKSKPERIGFIYPYSEQWDKKLNELMDKYKFTKVGAHTAMLGNNEIWISNHPYASFRPRDIEVHAKDETVHRAFAKMLEDKMV